MNTRCFDLTASPLPPGQYLLPPPGPQYYPNLDESDFESDVKRDTKRDARIDARRGAKMEVKSGVRIGVMRDVNKDVKMDLMRNFNDSFKRDLDSDFNRDFKKDFKGDFKMAFERNIETSKSEPCLNGNIFRSLTSLLGLSLIFMFWGLFWAEPIFNLVNEYFNMTLR